MDNPSLKLLAEVAFRIVSWYLILTNIPKFLLVIAGLVGAIVLCLWKVLDCCGSDTRETIALSKRWREENSEALDASGGNFICLNGSGNRRIEVTTKQRRLGVM